MALAGNCWKDEEDVAADKININKMIFGAQIAKAKVGDDVY